MIQVIHRTFDILEFLAQAPDGLSALEENYVVAAVNCMLCGTTTIETFKMVQVNYDIPSREPYLKSVPVPYDEAAEASFKSEVHTRPTCKVCKVTLLEKSKEELKIEKAGRRCAF